MHACLLVLACMHTCMMCMSASMLVQTSFCQGLIMAQICMSASATVFSYMYRYQCVSTHRSGRRTPTRRTPSSSFAIPPPQPSRKKSCSSKHIVGFRLCQPTPIARRSLTHSGRFLSLSLQKANQGHNAYEDARVGPWVCLCVLVDSVASMHACIHQFIHLPFVHLCTHQAHLYLPPSLYV